MNHINVVYFSLWRASATLPQRHLCALTTAMKDAAWKHFQVETEQFNEKRLMNHTNLYVPKECLFRNRIIRSRKWLHAISVQLGNKLAPQIHVNSGKN